MTDHAAFVPLSSPPRATSPASVMLPIHGARQLGFASRTTSFSDEHELSNQHDWVCDILLCITRHPQFEVLFPSIHQCLQLNDRSWKTYWTLREDSDARSRLEALHPSIWHTPPDEIWANIVHLRHNIIFPNFRSLILVEIQNAYCRSHGTVSNPVQHASRDGLTWDIRSGAMMDHSSVFAPTPSPAVPTSDHNAPSVPLNAGPRRNQCGSPSGPVQPGGHANLQRPYARLAPKGMAFQCPSLNCPKGFTKRAHYTKHLLRQHPDFGPRHPHFHPEMALRPRGLSNTSSERPSQLLDILPSTFDDPIDDSGVDSLMPADTEVMYMGEELMLGILNVNSYYNGGMLEN